jgi:5-methylcytosine-specific restriction endonuclease McrA
MNLWEQQNGICPYLMTQINLCDAQLDHVLPISLGGTHDISNLQWIHHRVNKMKWDYSVASLRLLVEKLYETRDNWCPINSCQGGN